MSQPAERERIVVIDDDPVMRLSCRQILEKTGYAVTTYDDGAQGVAGVAELKPSLLVVDLKMPGLSGIDVIHRVLQIDAQLVVIVITGYATVDTAVEAMKCGAYDFLPKPFSPDELRMIVRRGLERRRLQQDSARLELERELLRRRFVTFVSHQLKSPLAAIHQYLDVLQQLGDVPDIAARRREWIQRCLRRTEDLQTLISDWLTLAKVEGHALAGTPVRVEVTPIIANLLDAYASMAAEGAVTLDAGPAPAEAAVRGDANCLGVLFDNLIVNAIRYNRPGGTVTVNTAVDAGEVVIEVRDTGVGIPAHDLPRLFDEFFRVHDETTSRVSGTGLGLPICRRIVAELGGGIEVESEVGAGSVFRVRLPAYREADPGGHAEPPEAALQQRETASIT